LAGVVKGDTMATPASPPASVGAQSTRQWDGTLADESLAFIHIISETLDVQELIRR